MTNTVSLSADFAAHPSGALWIASSRTLVIADVHLGYGWAQRRRGELGPLADERTREKLFSVVDVFQPAAIVFLGDLVHAPRPSLPERQWTESMLVSLAERAELIAIRGNHDRRFHRDFGHLPVATAPAWQTGLITAIHGDRFDVAIPIDHTLLIGHLHPSLTVLDAAGASHRVPLFLHNRHCILLPAFSPFAKGFDVSRGLPGEVMKLFRGHTIEAVALSNTRAVALGSLDEAQRRLFASDRAAPARFRFPKPAK